MNEYARRARANELRRLDEKGKSETAVYACALRLGRFRDLLDLSRVSEEIQDIACANGIGFRRVRRQIQNGFARAAELPPVHAETRTADSVRRTIDVWLEAGLIEFSGGGVAGASRRTLLEAIATHARRIGSLTIRLSLRELSKLSELSVPTIRKHTKSLSEWLDYRPVPPGRRLERSVWTLKTSPLSRNSWDDAPRLHIPIKEPPESPPECANEARLRDLNHNAWYFSKMQREAWIILERLGKADSRRLAQACGSHRGTVRKWFRHWEEVGIAREVEPGVFEAINDPTVDRYRDAQRKRDIRRTIEQEQFAEYVSRRAKWEPPSWAELDPPEWLYTDQENWSTPESPYERPRASRRVNRTRPPKLRRQRSQRLIDALIAKHGAQAARTRTARAMSTPPRRR